MYIYFEEQENITCTTGECKIHNEMGKRIFLGDDKNVRCYRKKEKQFLACESGLK